MIMFNPSWVFLQQKCKIVSDKDPGLRFLYSRTAQNRNPTEGMLRKHDSVDLLHLGNHRTAPGHTYKLEGIHSSHSIHTSWFWFRVHSRSLGHVTCKALCCKSLTSPSKLRLRSERLEQRRRTRTRTQNLPMLQ